MPKEHPCFSCYIHKNKISKKNNPDCEKCKAAETYDDEIRKNQPTTVSTLKVEASSKKETPSTENTKTKKKTNKSCSVEGCEHPHLAKGLCSRHYWQMKRPPKNKKKTGKNKVEPMKTNQESHEIEDILITDDIWKKLEEIGKREMRPPKYQAAYFINKAVEEYYSQINQPQ